MSQNTFDTVVDACGEADFIGISDPDGEHQFSVSLQCKLAEKLRIGRDSDIFHKELFAICVAAYLSPCNCSLRVFTDSQNCIYALKNGGN